MSEAVTSETMAGHGGTLIAVHRMAGRGDGGPPVVMIHGLASNAQMNWIRFGHAARIAESGRSVIMPDLRCHGASAAPHDPAAYPSEVALRDVQAVLAALDLGEIDLVGYSLGARLSVMLAAGGLEPRRLVLGGMGLEALRHWLPRRDYYLAAVDRWETVAPGDRDYMVVQFMKTTGIDPVAIRLFLLSLGEIPAGTLERIAAPTLVIAGRDDDMVGSPAALADTLADARYQAIDGNHMSAIMNPDFGSAIARYLSA